MSRGFETKRGDPLRGVDEEEEEEEGIITGRDKVTAFYSVTVVLDVFVWDLEKVVRGRKKGGGIRRG